MPKGVEHTLEMAYQLAVSRCWISDAERRWAHTKIKGSLWQFQVLNLWCRKALSTVFVRRSQGLLSLCWISDAERRWALNKRLWVPVVWLCWISDAERRWAQVKTATSALEVRVLNLWCRKALSTIRKYQGSLSRPSVESLMPKGVEHDLSPELRVAIARVLNLWCRKALSTC